MWKQGNNTNKLKIQYYISLWAEGKGEGNLKGIVRIYIFTWVLGIMIFIL